MKYYGIDIETDDPCIGRKMGASWVYGEGEILVTGVYNATTGEKKAYDGAGGASVKKLLTNPGVTLVGANIVYDIGWLCSEFGLRAKDVKAEIVSVDLVEAVIDEYQKYSLDALATKWLHERKGAEPLQAWAAKHNLKGDFRRHLKLAMYGDEAKGIEAVPDLVRAYVISDADQPVRIWQKQKEVIEARGLWKPCIRKNKLVKVVLGMKQRGIKIDVKKKAENYEIAKKAFDELETNFFEKYGKVNINSNKQVGEMFDRLGVPYRCKIRVKGYKGMPNFEGAALRQQKKALKRVFSGVRIIKGQLVVITQRQYAGRTTADLADAGYAVTCNPKLDKNEMAVLKGQHQVARDLIEYKQVTNIITKFLGPDFDRFIAPDGRIHADFVISGARQTGRFSAKLPNLQQIPSKTKLFAKTDREINLAKMCREVLIPDTGMLLGKMDYSGQENVLMAHFAVGTGADEIREKYNTTPDFDFHAYMGDATGLTEEYGFDEQGNSTGRKYAKNCAFGIGYGMQLPTMMENFNWDQEKAEHIMDVYHDAAPFVRETMDAVSDIIVRRGFIYTLGGKQLHLEKYRAYDDHTGAFIGMRVNTDSAYKGFNKLIQGSAADMMEEALVKIYEADLDDVFPLYLTVHDEIDFGVPKTNEAFNRLSELKYIMEHALLEDDGTPSLAVPIRVDPELGPSWGKMYDFSENEEKFRKMVS